MSVRALHPDHSGVAKQTGHNPFPHIQRTSLIVLLYFSFHLSPVHVRAPADNHLTSKAHVLCTLRDTYPSLQHLKKLWT